MAECKLIRSGAAFHGKQGLDYLAGISAENTGAQAICMHLLEIPPGVVPSPTITRHTRRRFWCLKGQRRCVTARTSTL